MAWNLAISLYQRYRTLLTHPYRRGFTLTEILVVLATLTVLASVALASAAVFKQRATEIRCLWNLRRIGMASMLYAADNQMQLPSTIHQRRMGLKSWTLSLQPYTTESIEFRCPAEANGRRTITYLLNDYLTANPAGARDLDFSRLDRLDEPARTLMFAEASPGYTGSDHFHFSDYYGGRMPPDAFERQVETKRHDGKAHYLFADGHAEPLRQTTVHELLQRYPSRFLQPTD